MMYKIVIIVLLSLVFVLDTRVLARSPDEGDCAIFREMASPSLGLGGGLDAGDWLEKIYPSQNRTIAVQNLRAYCCSIPSLSHNLQCDDPVSSYAASPHLYDHLIDVGWRSLDAVMMYPGQLPDPLGLSRYDEQGRPQSDSELLQYSPKYRADRFGAYRGWDNQGRWTSNFQAYGSSTTSQYAQAAKDWNQGPTETTPALVGLAQRYIMLCHLSQYLRPIGGSPVMVYEDCHKLAQSRIQDAIVQFQSDLFAQSMRLLNLQFDLYAHAHVTQDKLGQLLNKFYAMQMGLTMLDSKIGRITRMCAGD